MKIEFEASLEDAKHMLRVPLSAVARAVINKAVAVEEERTTLDKMAEAACDAHWSRKGGDWDDDDNKIKQKAWHNAIRAALEVLADDPPDDVLEAMHGVAARTGVVKRGVSQTLQAAIRKVLDDK